MKIHYLVSPVERSTRLPLSSYTTSKFTPVAAAAEQARRHGGVVVPRFYWMVATDDGARAAISISPSIFHGGNSSDDGLNMNPTLTHTLSHSIYREGGGGFHFTRRHSALHGSISAAAVIQVPHCAPGVSAVFYRVILSSVLL